MWRARLQRSFELWKQLIRDGLAGMRDRGELNPTADPAELALALLAAVQGGLLLSQVRRETELLETAVDTVIAYIARLTV